MTDRNTISSSGKQQGRRRALLRSLVLLLAMAPVSLASAQDIKRVTVVSAREGAVVGTVAATGTVVAREEVPVHAEVDGGIIRAVLVDAGEYAEAGMPLAEIDTADAELALDRNTVELRRARMMIAQETARLEKARVSEAEAGKELERSRSLTAEGASSERMFSEHENEHARAAVDLEIAGQTLQVAHAELELIEHNRA
ncbi:efflux RND transporter periplasmic adaptor subunit [Martelella soudanensis]|uniref:biotin/lipoyl-binding protein n=1 Tax=unclassified Martelella TaxID=2629616 RepID=UPI0015DDE032|nr:MULTISPECIES: biotin/lipoyl-binding protein [unclassified Martelella]